MKKRKHEKNFIRNRSGGMKQKLPGRLLSLMCALVLVFSTVFLDLDIYLHTPLVMSFTWRLKQKRQQRPVQRLRQQIWETMSRR